MIAGFLVALSLAGCGGGSAGARTDGKLRVVATTGMVGDVVRNVGGEHVHVDVLMGPGVDPHLYKASPGDVSLINRADTVVYSGLHLEGKMGEIFERISRRKPTIALGEAVDAALLLEAADGVYVYDPHLWFDVSLWAETVMPFAERLAKIDPDHGDEYRNNATRYIAELRELHEWCIAELSHVPSERRVLVTAHDAFRYFGRAYGIEVLGIQGISTDSEAGLREVNGLIDTIVRRGVKAVFVETSVPPKNVQALVEGSKRRGHPLRIGGELFSDAMGDSGTPQGTYRGMVRHNVTTIVEALR